MWVDWALFKVLTVIGWGISLWSLIVAWTWLAEAKCERKELNLLYYVYEKIRITCKPVASGANCGNGFEVLASYELFPALECERRCIELVSTQLCCNCRSSRRRRSDWPSQIRLCPAPGSTPEFCVEKSGDTMTYWADLTQQVDCNGRRRCQPFSIRGSLDALSDECSNAYQSCYLELVFHSTGSYFYCQVSHVVRIPIADILCQ